MTETPPTLADLGQVHVSHLVARNFARDAELRDLHLGDATILLYELLRTATPIETRTKVQAWGVEAPEHGVRITARVVVPLEKQVCVLAVSTRRLAAGSLAGAEWSERAIGEYLATRRVSRAQAEPERVLLLDAASPVDVEVQPERWRARIGLLGFQAVLTVSRDAEGRPYIEQAVASSLKKGRRRRRGPK